MKTFGVVLKIVFWVLILLSIGYAQMIMYIDPPRVPQMAVGEQFTLQIRVRNAAGVYSWQAGFSFDPNVLKGISVTEGSFLNNAHGVGHAVFWIPQGFDNVNGILNKCACMQLGEDSGGVGDGDLMEVVMEVIGLGSSIIDLDRSDVYIQAELLGIDCEGLPFFCQDGFYGNEIGLPTPSFQISQGVPHQTRPAVAWNSTNNEFLVAWEQYSTPTGNSDIWGQRVSSAGGLLGLISIESSMLRYLFSPCVSWNGTNYLVAYTSWFLSAPPGDYDIRATVVSPAGGVVSRHNICTDIRYDGFPAIAWNGSNHLVVWKDHRNAWNNPYIYGQLVNSAGELIGSNFQISSWDNYVETTPCVASDGSDYLVIWVLANGNNPYAPIYGQRIDANGNLIDPKFQIANNGAMPDIAWDGTNYLVVYQRPIASQEWDIYGRRVSSAGALVGDEFAINTAARDQTIPRVIYEPGSGKYLIVWVSEQSMPAIYAQRINLNGTLSGAPFLLADASYHQIFPSMAYGNPNELIVWADLRNGTDFDIYGDNPEPPTGVELSSFSATQSNYGIVLTWRTESESSIVQYSLLKHREGKDGYKELTRIPGRGSSPSPKSYSYRDEEVQPGIRYYYKLGVVKIDGNTKWYGPVSAMVYGTDVYLKVYPNPTRGSIVIRYSVPKKCYTNLTIYDAAGRVIRRLFYGEINPGDYSLRWDCRDDFNNHLGSGIYFCELEAEEYKTGKKVLLLE